MKHIDILSGFMSKTWEANDNSFHIHGRFLEAFTGLKSIESLSFCQ